MESKASTKGVSDFGIEDLDDSGSGEGTSTEIQFGTLSQYKDIVQTLLEYGDELWKIIVSAIRDNYQYEHNIITKNGENEYFKINYFDKLDTPIHFGTSFIYYMKDFNISKHNIFSKDLKIQDIITILKEFSETIKITLGEDNKWIPIEFTDDDIRIKCSIFRNIISEFQKKSPSSVSVFHESDHEKTKKREKKTEHVKYQSYHSDNSVFSEKMKKSIISNSSKYPRNYEFDVPRHPSDPNFKLKRNKDEYSFTGEIIDFKFPKTLSNGQMQGGYGKIKLEVGDKFYYAYFHVSAVLNQFETGRTGHVQKNDRIKCNLSKSGNPKFKDDFWCRGNHT